MNEIPATQSRRGAPNAWLVIGGVVTLLLVAVGVVSAVSWLSHQTETQHQVYEHAASDISVELGTGDVTITAGPSGTVSVERRLRWSFAKPTIDEQWDGQTLRVTTTCRAQYWPGPGCGVDYRLEVPEGIPVRVRTSTGDVEIHSILGALDLATSTGDIRVTGATGALRLDASTGDIRVSDATSATVDASASTGDITLDLGGAPQSVTAHTSTGDVLIAVPDGSEYRVDAQTSTGDVRVSVERDDDAGRSIIAETSTGDIEVRYG